MQRRRRHIQRCRHKGQFAPGLFRVVCMFNPLIWFVCMWMQFALRMGCFLTGCFSQTTSYVLSTIPLLDGHCSTAAVASHAAACSNAAASAHRSFPPLIFSTASLNVEVILVGVLDMCACSCRALLLLCLLVCWFPVSPFQRPIIQFLSLAQLSAWQL